MDTTKQKRKHYSKLPMALPIELKVKHMGNTMTYVFKEGDKVNCPWCGEEIILTPGVVSRFMHPIDNNPFVICPNESCEHITSLVYFCGEGNKTKIGCWDAEFVKTEMDHSA